MAEILGIALRGGDVRWGLGVLAGMRADFDSLRWRKVLNPNPAG